MKVYIVQDMEGVSGIVQWEHALKEMGPDRVREARLLMTREANAAVQGARDAGVKQVYLHESHHFIVEELPEGVNYVVGSPYIRVDRTFDGLFFVGQHSMGRTQDGVLAHSWSDRIRQMWVNGEPMGEIGMTAAYAGSFGVPVLLVTGDEAATREARALLGSVETAAVKKGLGLHSAVCLSPEDARRLIRERARMAVERASGCRPFVVKGPVEIRIDFNDPVVAERCLLFPGVRRMDATTVAYRGKDYRDAFRFRQFQALINWF